MSISPYVYPGIGTLPVRLQIEGKRKGMVLYNADNIFRAAVRVFEICNKEKYSADLVKSKTRKREIVEIRQCAMYLIQSHTKMSLNATGAMFSGRDHSTVIHGVRTWQDLIDTSKKHYEITESVRNMVEQIVQEDEARVRQKQMLNNN